jgi:uncharacterized membrane protein
MLKNLSEFSHRNKYKIAIFGLMLGASAISIFLVIARVAVSDSTRHTNLIFNLFLAWIPFILSYVAYAVSWKRVLLYYVLPIAAFLWLIFFPNAPYILTDLQHLARESTSAPLWYDVIVMVWFAWTGMLLGLVSLYLMHDIVQRAFGRAFGWMFVFVASGLSSFGVYLGRFIRFNSWDILQDPKEVAVSLFGLAIEPSLRMLAFTSLFTIFYLFVYLTLYSFGHLHQEHTHAK